MHSAIYAAIKGDGYPLLNDNTAISAISRWEKIILDAAPLITYPDIPSIIRQHNPSAKILGYQTMFVWNNPGGPRLWQDLWHAISSLPHGLLYKPDGTYWISNVNLADTQTVQTFAAIVAGNITAPIFNEIFLDVLVPTLTADQTDIDFQRAGFSTMADFATAWNAGVKTLLSLITMPVTGNYGPLAAAGAHAWMVTEYADDMGFAWQEQHLKSNYWAISQPRGGGKDSAENIRRARYGYCISLLFDSYHSMGRIESDHAWMREHLDWWYPEYAVDLGLPVGPAYPYSVGSVDVKRRDFTRGVIIVNPTAHPVSVRGLPLCHPPGGAWKHDWSVPAYDGLVLSF